MKKHEEQVILELLAWKQEMQRSPSLPGMLTAKIQHRINGLIPEKIHTVVTTAIKQMVRVVLFGAELTTPVSSQDYSLQERENIIRSKIDVYTKSAAAEGAVTGAGGILLALADFPLWLSLKMKMLFEIASWYGYDIREYSERIYILHIFKLTFSSQQTRNITFSLMADWNNEKMKLPADIHQFDWRSLQQEYRDYIDLAKLIQLIPGVGAIAGAYVNHRLTLKLGKMAMNAYRLRLEADSKLQP